MCAFWHQWIIDFRWLTLELSWLAMRSRAQRRGVLPGQLKRLVICAALYDAILEEYALLFHTQNTEQYIYPELNRVSHWDLEPR